MHIRAGTHGGFFGLSAITPIALVVLLVGAFAGCAAPIVGSGPTATNAPIPTPTATPLPRSGLAVVTRSSDGIEGIDPVTDAVLWDYSDVLVASQFVSMDSRVYLIAQSMQNASEVVALDIQSGAVLWSASASSWQGAITAYGSRVYVATNYRAYHAANTYITTSAYNADDGALIWRVWRRYVNPVNGIQASSTTLMEDETPSSSKTGSKEARVTYSAASGRVEGAFIYPFVGLEGSSLLTFAECGDQWFFTLIFFSSSFVDVCLTGDSATTGHTQWNVVVGNVGTCGVAFFLIPVGCDSDSSDLSGEGFQGFASDSGVAYVTAMGPNSTNGFETTVLDAISVSTGRTLWTYTIPSDTEGVNITPTPGPSTDGTSFSVVGADAHAVYFISSADMVTALSTSTRKILWRCQILDAISEKPISFAEAGGLALLTSGSTQYGIRLSDGSLVWPH